MDRLTIGRAKRKKERVEEAVGRLLSERGETLALAESCTGGGIGERVTRVPGSSAWFLEGRVVYSNEAKRRLLGVPKSVLEKHGAVSAECAEAMARGVRRRSGADWVLAVTGLAGPGGGRPEKPAGLVFIAWAGNKTRRVESFRFSGGRALVRKKAVLKALERLKTTLEE